LKKFILFFILFFNIHLYADTSERLNSFFRNHLIFTQVSLNSIENEFVESSGEFKNELDGSITIEVFSPFKEIYYINKGGIEIHDLEFNQIKKISNQEISKNSFLSIIQNNFHIDDNSIEIINESSFIIIIEDKDYVFNFINNDLLHVKYKDNMEINNLIKFSKI
tara:strand:- start:562 stop:1056 length:495 start_codon:yes stop_codon:yes gene_type:complete